MISDKEAEIMLQKAKRELRTAKRNLEDKLYPEAVFDAQRVAEKAIKAAIRITGHEYAKDRDPSGLFGRIMLKELKEKIPEDFLKEVTRLGKTMNKLAKLRLLVEYPLESGGEIIPPSGAVSV
ncbi:MAG: HEPN domain-containing protein [Candidatus Baldrarchaeia archaeon]